MTGTRRPRPFSTLLNLVFGALLALSSFFLSAQPAQAREMVAIAGQNVNMRSGPGVRHPALYGLARGYPLEVIGRRGSWVQVRDFEKDKGWVARSLTNRVPHSIVQSKIVNLRSAPNTRSRVVAKLSYGDVLRTLEKKRDWIKVRDPDGKTGWVSQGLVWGW